MSKSSSVAVGSIVENRYRILRELGRGGFGRSYLAEDTHEHNYPCVLKEFAPQVQNKNDLQKAQELFEREAGMLCNLQHPQIPRFQKMMWVRLGDRDALFLVQDYIEGPTYWELLQSQGKFSEAEVTQLLLQLLPVLEYIHSRNVIHRDISPDNLIQRTYDKLPFLIDFGCVKQIAANALSQLTGQAGTVVGKSGYAPDEQMQQGKVSATSDLYALAVTALVLLTGTEPQDLYDSFNGMWCWRQKVSVSPTLGSVLDAMLAHRPRDRYQSAREVRQALENPNLVQSSNHLSQMGTVVVAPGKKPPNPPAAPVGQAVGNRNVSKMGTILSRMATVVAAPGKRLRKNFTSFLAKKQQSDRRELKIIAMSIGAALVVVVGSVAVANMAKSLFQPRQLREGFSRSTPDVPLPRGEQARLAKIIQRRQALKLDEGQFNKKVDALFYAQHPELQGRSLTNKSEDAALRKDWCQIAENLLDRIEQGDSVP
ncbi:MAG TPA: serine/threonine protein kinase [Cyanobacteria bacterium UBA8803]|nr:serine/threonine protein kinase [Cyanobacteria bacterium UBA8803]